MMMFYVLIIYTAFYQFLSVQSEVKKRLFNMRGVGLCKDQGTGEITWDLLLRRKSRDEVLIEGNISLTRDLGSEVAAGIEVQQWGNGGWIENTFVFSFHNFCSDYGTVMEPSWSSLWIHTGLKAPIQCPIPKGVYQLKGFPAKEYLNSTLMSTQEPMRNEPQSYRTVVRYFEKNNNTLLGCHYYTTIY